MPVLKKFTVNRALWQSIMKPFPTLKVFEDALIQYHNARKTPIRQFPYVLGKKVNLRQLFISVMSRGGYKKVNEMDQWDEVMEELKLVSSNNEEMNCTNCEFALQTVYVRYLEQFERYQYSYIAGRGCSSGSTCGNGSGGEDSNTEVDISKHSSLLQELSQRDKSFQATLVYENTPRFYNDQQHLIDTSIRAEYGLSCDLRQHCDLRHLLMSLSSGLDNEIELALNTLLIITAGISNISLRDSGDILDLLAAVTGIMAAHDGSLTLQYSDKEWMLNCRQYWNSKVKDATGRLFLIPNIFECSKQEFELLRRNLQQKESLFGDELFAPVLTREEELLCTRRVNSVATILYNVTMDAPNNCAVIAHNSQVLRFLFLSSFSRDRMLRRIALQTLGRLSLVLTDDEEEVESFDDNGKTVECHKSNSWFTEMLLSMLHSMLASDDRYDRITACETLQSLCMREDNHVIIAKLLTRYDIIIRLTTLLVVPDIQPICCALETLVSLSQLGDSSCRKMALCSPLMRTLLHYTKVEAQIFGQAAVYNIKTFNYRPPPSHTPSQSIPSVSSSIPQHVPSMSLTQPLISPLQQNQQSAIHRLLQSGITAPSAMTRQYTSSPVSLPNTPISSSSSLSKPLTPLQQINHLLDTFNSPTSTAITIPTSSLQQLPSNVNEISLHQNSLSSLQKYPNTSNCCNGNKSTSVTSSFSEKKSIKIKCYNDSQNQLSETLNGVPATKSNANDCILSDNSLGKELSIELVENKGFVTSKEETEEINIKTSIKQEENNNDNLIKVNMTDKKEYMSKEIKEKENTTDLKLHAKNETECISDNKEKEKNASKQNDTGKILSLDVNNESSETINNHLSNGNLDYNCFELKLKSNGDDVINKKITELENELMTNGNGNLSNGNDESSNDSFDSKTTENDDKILKMKFTFTVDSKKDDDDDKCLNDEYSKERNSISNEAVDICNNNDRTSNGIVNDSVCSNLLPLSTCSPLAVDVAVDDSVDGNTSKVEAARMQMPPPSLPTPSMLKRRRSQPSLVSMAASVGSPLLSATSTGGGVENTGGGNYSASVTVDTVWMESSREAGRLANGYIQQLQSSSISGATGKKVPRLLSSEMTMQSNAQIEDRSARAKAWLRQNFRMCEGSSVPKQELLTGLQSELLDGCVSSSTSPHKRILSVHELHNCIKEVFGSKVQVKVEHYNHHGSSSSYAVVGPGGCNGGIGSGPGQLIYSNLEWRQKRSNQFEKSEQGQSINGVISLSLDKASIQDHKLLTGKVNSKLNGLLTKQQEPIINKIKWKKDRFYRNRHGVWKIIAALRKRYGKYRRCRHNTDSCKLMDIFGDVKKLENKLQECEKVKVKDVVDTKNDSSEVKNDVNKVSVTTVLSQSGTVPSSPAAAQLPTKSCLWAGCGQPISGGGNQMLVHLEKQHIIFFQKQQLQLYGTNRICCQWQGCSSSNIARAPLSLINHIVDTHLQVLMCQNLQKQPSISTMGIVTVSNNSGGGSFLGGNVLSSNIQSQHPYQYVIQPQQLDKSGLSVLYDHFRMDQQLQSPQLPEGPITKHIRISASVILRNMSRHSILAKQFLRRNRQHLISVAMSNQDCAPIIIQCLDELDQVTQDVDQNQSHDSNSLNTMGVYSQFNYSYKSQYSSRSKTSATSFS